MQTQKQNNSTLETSKHDEEKLKIAIALLFLFSSYKYFRIRNLFKKSYPSREVFESYSSEILEGMSYIYKMSFFKRKISSTFMAYGLKYQNEIFLEIMSISFTYSHADMLNIDSSSLENELVELLYQ